DCPGLRQQKSGIRTHGGPLQRRSGPHRHLCGPGPAAAAGGQQRHLGHLRLRVRPAAPPLTHGADGGPVRVPPPVRPGRPQGQEAPQRAGAPPLSHLRKPELHHAKRDAEQQTLKPPLRFSPCLYVTYTEFILIYDIQAEYNLNCTLFTVFKVAVD
uniref:Uncharacterized protein n=1 Tax=Tetraodon nigroviridis TaxID=99883 RepID=H3C7Z7_TETNG